MLSVRATNPKEMKFLDGRRKLQHVQLENIKTRILSFSCTRPAVSLTSVLHESL